MRTIKFRIFNKKIKSYIDIHSSAIMIDELNNLNDNLIVEQFTGLHDKNGKEIYTGDILQLKKLDGSVLLYKIFCVKGGFAFNTHQDDFYKPQIEIYFYESTSDMQNSSFISTLEIIGNIYENA
jgi:uncharacterized phage protein (TIGR01671 family)